MISDQPDWEQFWQDTAASYQRSRLLKWRYRLIAQYGVWECLKLIKHPQEIKSVLELGGGGGCFTEILARQLGIMSKNLVLIDKSSQGKLAWQQFSGYGDFVKADLFKYNFGKRKFDLVLSRGLIEHWAKTQERLKLIKRHLQLSRKYVLIRVPKKGWFVNFLLYRNLAIRLVRAGSDGYEKLYSAQEIKKEVRQAGLKIIGFKEGLMSFTVLGTLKRSK